MSAEVQEALPLRVSAHRCVCNEGGGPDNKLLRKCWFCSVCVCVCERRGVPFSERSAFVID